MKDALNVYWAENLVGKLIKQKSLWKFTYSTNWLASKHSFPISISMPLQEQTFDHIVTHSFFCNLLPESDIRRKILLKLGFSLKNDFGLLKAIGGECAGALSIISEEDVLTNKGEYVFLEKDFLKDMLNHQSVRPLLNGIAGLRLSLAGAQDKLPIYIDGLKNMFLPIGLKASTHILKPNIPDYEDSALNEYFCMRLAGRVGLNVPEVSILKIDGNLLVVVKRYDRKKNKDEVIRLHQEDFCQAMSYSYEQKYESEGGPTLKNCFEIIDKVTSNRVLEKKSFLEWIIFNFFIGNADAHAKNISFLYNGNNITIAPFYDIMNTLIYPGLSNKMAMKIGNENRFKWVKERHWKKLSVDAKIKEGLIIDTMNKFSRLVPIEAEKLIKEVEKQGHNIKVLKKILENINSRSR